MKKHYLHAAVLIFSLCLSVTAAMAQTTTISGVVRTEIEVKEGKVIVILPDDIRAGDAISGTVTAEAKGNTEKERARNTAALAEYTVNLAGAQYAVPAAAYQPIKFVMAAGTRVSVFNNKAAGVGSFLVLAANNVFAAAGAVSTPSHALTGAPVRITGNFDGDMSNTKCFLDGNGMQILAESPRQTICTMPQAVSGPHNITVEEKEKTTVKKISAVNMDLSAPKTNLSRGEKTEITVAVSGLEGTRSNTTINITNASVSTISLAGGNTQTIIITPSQVNNGGTYSQTITAQSLSAGTFMVNANLHLPETTPLVITPTQPQLVAPVNGETIEVKKDDKPAFRWTAAAPTGSAPAKYRLRIVPVYPGQETAEAFRNNTPLLDSTVINKTNIQLPGSLPFWATGQEYGWGVSALDEYGNPYFPANPFSSPNKFKADTRKNNGGDKVLMNPPLPKDEPKAKNCNKEKADLDAAKDALKNAQAKLAKAQQALQSFENWLADIKEKTGRAQKAALGAKNADKKALEKRIFELDAIREAAGSEHMALNNAVNAAQAAVDKAAANLKEKEDAYNKCAGK